jgi:hypothetical protein
MFFAAACPVTALPYRKRQSQKLEVFISGPQVGSARPWFALSASSQSCFEQVSRNFTSVTMSTVTPVSLMAAVYLPIELQYLTEIL